MAPPKPTNRKRKISAVKNEATRLHSRIVRHTKGPGCQVADCPRPATDCAHIVGRTYSHTRTDEANAFALCAQCHRHFTNWQGDWIDFVDATIGRPAYNTLVTKARDGVGVKLDWYAELDRLRLVAAGLGIK